jgi:photosystem II stability/assembly factor-like uncharacterized protein
MTQPSWLGGMRWRLLGPYRGGRVTTVAGHPTDPMTFYFGASGGGLWKTDNGGHTWNPMADDALQTAAVGAIAISPSHPHILYAGMGESVVVEFHALGDGIYKSTDAGRTWQHMGLAETQTIGSIAIHPSNPDIVYVAALGHRFGSNAERGVYRTTDGGQTWEQVLFRSTKAGAIQVSLDEHDPNILYAAFWEQLMQPWTETSGGEDSAVYRSLDGGDTWEDISHRPGLPNGVMGKIALAVSPVKSGRVWALIEAFEGGIYRSDDYGLTWTWLSNERNLLVRARFSFFLLPDPVDANTLYVASRKLWKSTDGGRTFGQMNTSYVDQHALWVDPKDTRRMIVGNDGGASVSFDAGRSWSTQVNQPTAEIYRIATDNYFPYRVYGSQQDNSTLAVPSRSERTQPSQLEWHDVGGGESGYITVRPDNPNIVYSSDLPGLGVTRYNHANFQIREIGPWGEAGAWEVQNLKYRFNWSVPVELSPHDPNILYIAGNVLFRSTDEGASWEEISPDLTRHDPTKMVPVGGPISREDSLAHQFPAISTVHESPVERGVIWVGTDDGLVQVTRDDGATWTNVTPHDMPEWALLRLHVSRHARGKAYAAAANYRMDDYRPHLFRTDDYGQSWTRISDGIPDGHFSRALYEDIEVAGLLFAATDAGVYCSMDDGGNWFMLKLNLPAVEVYDLTVKEDDLVIATHGRSMWSLDNIAPLRQIARDAGLLQQDVRLLPPEPVIRITRQVYGLESLLSIYAPYVSQNAAAGVVIDYYLKAAPEHDITIELVGADGTVYQSVTTAAPPPPTPEPAGPLAYQLRGSARLVHPIANEEELGVRWGALNSLPAPWDEATKHPGLNRVELPLLAAGAQFTPNVLGWVTPPALVPGTYTVRLTMGDIVQEQPVVVQKDPRVETTQAEYEAQHALLVEIRDRVTSIHGTIARLYTLRDQLQERLKLTQQFPAFATLAEPTQSVLDTLTEIENLLIQPGLNIHSGELDGTHFPDKIDGKLQALSYQVARSDNAPTQQAVRLWRMLDEQAQTEFRRFEAVLTRDVPPLNRLYAERAFPLVLIPA